MALRKMDLFHGALLTKLVRRDRDYSLRLIETNIKRERRVYQINGVSMLAKYRAPNLDAKEGGLRTWTFNFKEDERKYLEDGSVQAIALVCGLDSARRYKEMEICLLEGEKLGELRRFIASSRWTDQINIVVKSVPGDSLRAGVSGKDDEVTVIRKRIETWELPE